jgi:hypothetical protein
VDLPGKGVGVISARDIQGRSLFLVILLKRGSAEK